MAELVGKTVGKYRIVARLGRGGMAEVYKAFQPGLDRYVAIKVMHAFMVSDEGFVHRFEREALNTGRLRHPNIVQALDFDREGEMYYMVMEYIDGPTLKNEIKARQAVNKPFTLPEIARIFVALGSALDYAHGHGMVHRDLKPANVMINEQGQVVLTDFGIARMVGATQYTATGALSGTPAYMSPEQGQGERGDERSDIYALGIMLYEMVTGAVPYDADTPFAVIMKHISEPLPMPSRVNPTLPEVVERVILKAMSKEPADRYQTAGAMAQALRQAIDLPPGAEFAPLPVVAQTPKLQELDPTGSFTAANTAAQPRSDATLPTPRNQATAISTPATSTGGLPMLPLLVGGGAIVIILIAGLIGFFVLTAGPVEPTPDPALAVAAANTATAAANATAAAQAEATAAAQLDSQEATATAATQADLAPTQTALAVAAAAEATLARQTAEAELIAGVLGAQNSTATAETLQTQTAIETATAEFLANVTPTPLPTETPTPAPATNTPTPAPRANTPTPAPPTNTPPPQRAPISGKLAFPVDNGAAGYNVAIYDLSQNKYLFEIPDAHQPHFSRDGSTLLVNGERGRAGIWEYQMGSFGGREVSGIATSQHPFYNKDANSIITNDPQQAADGKWHLYAKIGLTPGDPTIALREARTGEIRGDNALYPLWHDDFTVIIKGCGYWANGACGIWRLLGFGVGGPPDQEGIIGGSLLISDRNVIPTDLKGNQYVYMSQEPGNWDVYLASVDGGAGVNLSNNPAIDGLPAISPGGDWVAFLSNRGGAWDIWVVPGSGGQAQALGIKPSIAWHSEYGGFENERMAWGR
jgi:hypothetical protein